MVCWFKLVPDKVVSCAQHAWDAWASVHFLLRNCQGLAMSGGIGMSYLSIQFLFMVSNA